MKCEHCQGDGAFGGLAPAAAILCVPCQQSVSDYYAQFGVHVVTIMRDHWLTWRTMHVAVALRR